MKKLAFILAFLLVPSVLLASIEVYFSPSKQTEDALVEFISKAKKTLDIAVYGFTNDRIATEVLSAKKRGVKVRIIVDKLQASGRNAKWKEVGARIDQKSGLMHNKFTIRDSKCVSTGSFNYTTGAVKVNRENLLIICDKKTTKKFSDEFNKLWENNT